MSKREKVLEIMSMAQLPDEVKLARLVRPWLGKAFSREQAKAIIKVYFEEDGKRTKELTDALMEEKRRQEALVNYRKGWKSVQEAWSRSPMDRFKSEVVGEHQAKIERAGRTMDIAQAAFGDYIRNNFDDDALAMMSLISGEERSYKIAWRDAGFRPTLSALIEVETRSRVNVCQTNIIHAWFIVYRVGRRVLTARVDLSTMRRSPTLQEAWASQLPESFVKAAPVILGQGFKIKSDLEGQQMLIHDPDGELVKTLPWTGRMVDE